MTKYVLITFILILLSNSLTYANPVLLCKDVLQSDADFVMNYNADTEMVILDAQPKPLGFTIPSQKFSTSFEWLAQTELSQVETYNKKMWNKKRIKLPVQGGLRGITANEQWMTYLFDQMPLFLSKIVMDPTSNLTMTEKQWLQQITQITQMGVEIEFSNEQKHSFDFHEQYNRAATTTGRIGDPIIINEDFVNFIDFDQMREKDLYAFPQDGHATVTLITAPKEIFQKYRKDNQQEAMKGYFSILVHELGHYLKIKDTPDRVLDIFASKVTDLMFKEVQFFDLGDYGQAETQFIFLNFPNQKSNQQILFKDSSLTLDITKSVFDYVQKQLTNPIQQISYQNIQWEKTHHWDSSKWSIPKALMLTADVFMQNGERQQLRLRIVADMSVPAELTIPSELTARGFRKDNIHEIPNNVSQNEFFVRLGIQKRSAERTTVQKKSRVTQEYSVVSKLKPMDTWKQSWMIEIPSHQELIAVSAEYTSDQFIWSNFFKKQKYQAQKTWFEYISTNQVMIHFEQPISETQVAQQFHVDHIQLKFKDQSIEEIQPKLKQVVSIEGSKPIARLHGNGFTNTVVQNSSLAKMKFYGTYEFRPNFKLPYVFLIEGFQSLRRADVRVVVFYESKEGFHDSEGFVINALKPNPFFYEMKTESVSPERYKNYKNMNVKGPLTHLFMSTSIPEILNGRKVKEVHFEAVYFLMKNNDQIYSPVESIISVLK